MRTTFPYPSYDSRMTSVMIGWIGRVDCQKRQFGYWVGVNTAMVLMQNLGNPEGIR